MIGGGFLVPPQGYNGIGVRSVPIITGTPGGVGLFREPPVFLQRGDVVEVEISGIGKLRNPVVREG